MAQGLMMRTKFCFVNVDCSAGWGVRLVDGCREIWGSCAIYVGICSLILANEWELRHLCPKKAAWCWEKNIGQNHQERHQSYPKTGCFASCLGTTLMSWDSSDGFINHPRENARPDSLHWDHRPGETPRGDTTGRHNGRHKGETQRGERKGGTKRKSKMKNDTFIVCKPEKLLL